VSFPDFSVILLLHPSSTQRVGDYADTALVSEISDLRMGNLALAFTALGYFCVSCSVLLPFGKWPCQRCRWFMLWSSFSGRQAMPTLSLVHTVVFFFRATVHVNIRKTSRQQAYLQAFALMCQAISLT
jgi:hypothetical protein